MTTKKEITVTDEVANAVEVLLAFARKQCDEGTNNFMLVQIFSAPNHPVGLSYFFNHDARANVVTEATIEQGDSAHNAQSLPTTQLQ